MFKLKGETLFGAFKAEVDGDLVSFPDNWLRNATPDDLARVGITIEDDFVPPPDIAVLKIQQTSLIQAQLAAADLKIIRSLAEGDTVRIEAHKASQAALRVQLK